MSRIISFRGKIETGNIDIVSLHTTTGSMGYRIKSLALIGQQPSVISQEATFKIFSVPQTTTTSTIDFSDNTLLGAGFYENDSTATQIENSSIIFDNVTFNQDIYLAMQGTASTSLNYYLELEQMPLDLNENTVATLKDIRNVA